MKPVGYTHAQLREDIMAFLDSEGSLSREILLGGQTGQTFELRSISDEADLQTLGNRGTYGNLVVVGAFALLNKVHVRIVLENDWVYLLGDPAWPELTLGLIKGYHFVRTTE